MRDIVRTVADLREIAIAEGRAAGRVAQLVPSVNAFIPKPHTPYEDEPLASEESLKEKLAFLQREFERMGNVSFRGMSVGEAVWEAYLAKMDESGADILEEAASASPSGTAARDRKSTRLNSSHKSQSRMPSSA